MVVASAVALAEAVPDAACARAASPSSQGEEVDLERRGRAAGRGRLRAGRPGRGPRPVRRSAATSSTSFRRPRSGPRAWSCSATRSSRSAGSRPSPSARSGRPRRLELSPAAELALEHRELAEAALEAERRALDATPRSTVGGHRAAPAGLPCERRWTCSPRRTAVIVAGAEEIDPALRDHWEDVTTAMHDDDATPPVRRRRRAAGRARGPDDSPAPTPARRSRFAPRPPARPRAPWPRPSRSSSGSCARATASSSPSSTRARPSARDTTWSGWTLTLHERGPPERGSLFAEARLAEGFVSPELKLAVIPFRRLVHRRRAAAPGGARALRGRGRPAGRRLRRPRGPRDRAVRRLRDEDRRRRHPRLPGAGVPRRGQGLRPHRPAREDHPLRRRRRRRAAALGARVEALGRGQVPRPPRGPRARGRAPEPLRRAQGAQRPRVRGRLGVGARARALVPVPRDGRPARGDRGGLGRHGGRRARWTA